MREKFACSVHARKLDLCRIFKHENRPCHDFRRHLDEYANVLEMTVLCENLMSNNFRKTAVLKKKNQL